MILFGEHDVSNIAKTDATILVIYWAILISVALLDISWFWSIGSGDSRMLDLLS